MMHAAFAGKTLAAKAAAGEAGISFYQMAGPKFIEAIGGVADAQTRCQL